MRFSFQFLSVCIIVEKLQIINLYIDPLSHLQIVVIRHGCPQNEISLLQGRIEAIMNSVG